MTRFNISGPKFDGAFCTVDTFRHLLTDEEAVSHLQNVARHLRKNSIYVLGLHLLPRNGIKQKFHNWQGTRGKLTVYSNITVFDINRKRREETLGYTLLVNRQKYQSVYKLRTYTFRQFRKLLIEADCFEIVNIYDLDYELNKPVKFNADTEEAVFLLRNK